MTDFVIDTMALVKYLEDELPTAADRAFRDAERGAGRLFLPEIALAEFIYIALRARLRVPDSRAAVDEFLDRLKASEHIALSCLPLDAWDVFVELAIPDLHDRMIATDALHRGVSLVSGDPSFAKVPGLQVVWR